MVILVSLTFCFVLEKNLSASLTQIWASWGLGAGVPGWTSNSKKSLSGSASGDVRALESVVKIGYVRVSRWKGNLMIDYNFIKNLLLKQIFH